MSLERHAPAIRALPLEKAADVVCDLLKDLDVSMLIIMSREGSTIAACLLAEYYASCSRSSMEHRRVGRDPWNGDEGSLYL